MPYSDGGKFDIFDIFLPDHQNLFHQIFKALDCLQEKTVTTHQKISVKYLKSSIHQNFPPSNLVHKRMSTNFFDRFTYFVTTILLLVMMHIMRTLLF